MTDPTPPGDSNPPASPPADPLYVAPDPWTPSPSAEPLVPPPGAPADPYTPAPGANADPYAPAADPYATPGNPAGAEANPYASPGSNPYATPSSGANPYATPSSGANPYATPSSGANPYATPSSGANPYATPSSGASPYAAPTSGANPYPAPPVSSPDPYAQAAAPLPPPPQPYGVVGPQSGGAYAKHDPNAYAPPSPYGVSGAGQPANYPMDYGYGSPYGQPGFPRRQTDGMAIAALVVSCASVFGLCLYGFGFVLAVVGAILGHVSRKRIRQTGAGGDGMALTGIIVGWSVTGISIALIIIFFTIGLSGGFD